MSDKIPAYVNRTRLCELLGVSDRTIDNWMAKGFPRPGRHGKWKWAKVEAYMDGDEEPAIASGDTLGEEVYNASKAWLESRH